MHKELQFHFPLPSLELSGHVYAPALLFSWKSKDPHHNVPQLLFPRAMYLFNGDKAF